MTTLQQEFRAAVRDAKRVKKQNVTFSAAVEKWLKDAHKTNSLRPKTIARYDELYRLYFGVIARKRLDQIAPEEVVALRMVMGSRMGSSGLNQARAVLAGAVRFARERYAYDGEDPSRWWTTAKNEPRRQREVLTVAEIERLCEHAAGVQDAALYRALAYGCLRISEARKLCWRHVDFEGSRLIVVDGKGGKNRVMPLAPQLREALVAHAHQNARFILDRDPRPASPERISDLMVVDRTTPVFTEQNGSYLDDSSVRRRLTAAAKRAGLGVLTPHALRHAGATLLAQEFPLHEVQEMLGHSSIQTTSIYLHAQPRKRDAERLGRLIEKASTGDERLSKINLDQRERSE